MNVELYQQIANAEKYQGDAGPPHVPQDQQAQMGLDWAKRQAERPAPPPPPEPMKPIIAVA